MKLIALLAVAVGLVLPACIIRQDCEGSCDVDTDCESGLVCIATQTEGSICLPAACAQCENGCSVQVAEETNEYGATISRECRSPMCL